MVRPFFPALVIAFALFATRDSGSHALANPSAGLDSLRILVDTGELTRAEPLARRLLRYEEADSRPDSLEMALILDQLGVILRRTGRERTAEAEATCRRALFLKEAVLGTDDASYAASLHGLGALYYARMEYERSRPLLTRAYEIRTKRLGEEHPDVAWSLMILGALESETGSDSAAAGSIGRAVAIQRKRPDTKEIDLVLGLNALATIRN
ncbi:MAG TPA: tetratricopeptide repeat protein, partial [Candidatus Eisenbacteria bacterium]|nr:tetratricopeptide repeat protein [Candidatus Eisenbacteria bacterium]